MSANARQRTIMKWALNRLVSENWVASKRYSPASSTITKRLKVNVINFADDLKFPYVLYSNVNTSGTLEFSFAHSLHGGSEMRLDFGEFHDRPMPKAHYTHRAHRENEKMREREWERWSTLNQIRASRYTTHFSLEDAFTFAWYVSYYHCTKFANAFTF